jgi:hypothetical protein
MAEGNMRKRPTMDHKKIQKKTPKTHKYNDWATCYWKLSITKTV